MNKDDFKFIHLFIRVVIRYLIYVNCWGYRSKQCKYDPYGLRCPQNLVKSYIINSSFSERWLKNDLVERDESKLLIHQQFLFIIISM